METRIRLFADTVARRLTGGRRAGWALMNKQSTGWASSAIFFNSLIEIGQEFAVTIGDLARDDHGEYVPVKALAESSTTSRLKAVR